MIFKFLLRVYIFFIKRFYYFPTYNLNFHLNLQNNLFIKCFNCNYHHLNKRLLALKKNYPNFFNRMASDHILIFIALSQKKIKKILEIGTFDGKNIFLMSKIFKNYTKIRTIDLPDNHDSFKNFYRRDNVEERKKFIKERNLVLSKIPNLIFSQISSVNLTQEKDKYDLIWLDGDHNYPIACIDIINSLRLIDKNGFIVCDDVYTEHIADPNIYESDATFDTLQILKKSGLIKLTLFYKRIDKLYNSYPKQRKHVALIEKIY